MNMLRAQRTSQDIAMMKYVFMRRDQGGFEVREIDSVKVMMRTLNKLMTYCFPMLYILK